MCTTWAYMWNSPRTKPLMVDGVTLDNQCAADMIKVRFCVCALFFSLLIFLFVSSLPLSCNYSPDNRSKKTTVWVQEVKPGSPFLLTLKKLVQQIRQSKVLFILESETDISNKVSLLFPLCFQALILTLY